MKKLFLLLILSVSVTGCLTPTAYISSETDPAYSLEKSDSIYLLVPADAPIRDRRFASFLQTEMISAGFNLTNDIKSSDYVLLFGTDRKTSQINSTLFIPQTQTNYGYVGDTFYSGTTTTTTVVPITENYTVQSIWLNLYATPDIAMDKYKTVWEGSIGVGADDYDQQPREVLRLLFDVFGSNYKAHTPIKSIEAND